ncbi:unnamed protein product, partial [Staurois parvus]
ATYLSLGPVVCSLQPVSPAVLYSRRPASSLWAPGCEPATHCACVSSVALHEWSCSLLGPVTCPKRLQGGRTPRRSDRKWERVPVKFGYLLPPPPPLKRGSSP